MSGLEDNQSNYPKSLRARVALLNLSPPHNGNTAAIAYSWLTLIRIAKHPNVWACRHNPLFLCQFSFQNDALCR